MKKLLAAAAFTALAASPTFAASAHRAHASFPANGMTASDSMAFAVADPYTVVEAGKYLGRDPDANVRLDLRREGDPANLASY